MPAVDPADSDTPASDSRGASDPLAAGHSPLELPDLDERPLVSVLVANYNYAAYVGEALESLLAQTYDHWEAIVCDDGSTDGSVEVVEGYAARDRRISLIRKPNGGAASALNEAFRHASGDILCILDADDSFFATKLALVVEAFRTSSRGILVHPLLVVDENGAGIQRKPAYGYFEEGWIAERTVRRGGRWSYMEASAVCLRAEVARAIFPIPEEAFRSWADAYVSLIAALVAEVGFIDEALASYRIHSANTSGFNRLDDDHGAKAMNGYERLITEVNARLSSFSPQRSRIDVSRNLGYLESALMAQLCAPPVDYRAAIRTYARYVALVIGDDIYTLPRKLLSLCFFGTSFLVPQARRSAWLSAGLTHSRFKERLRHALETIGRYAGRN